MAMDDVDCAEDKRAGAVSMVLGTDWVLPSSDRHRFFIVVKEELTQPEVLMKSRSSRPLFQLFALLLFALPVAALGGDDPPLPADCTEAMSTFEMNACAGAEFEKADVELNRVYKEAVASIPDMATGEQPFDKASWEEALRASQRAWIAFRDAECEDHVEMFWAGGSGRTVEIIGCKTEMTEQRTKDLKQRYEIE